MKDKLPVVALLWYGDREARDASTISITRFQSVAEALRTVGVETQTAVYNDEFADEVSNQLTKCDGVLVWVNPIEQGKDRTKLDALLRVVSDKGVFVSAHPDVILKMGTKEVLFRTQDMSWGCDTHLYETMQELEDRLPQQLKSGKPRVLKQYRGNGGNGVWKVQKHPSNSALVRVRHALRGSVEKELPFDDFLKECEIYFAGAGRMIDQAYQERLVDGMVRCYLVGNTVVGFGHQAINALFPTPPESAPGDAPQPGLRLYHPPEKKEFQAIKTKMENEWLTDLYRTLDIEAESLPLLWDADFLYGAKTESGEDTYVLCEINTSAVSPFPDSALEPLAHAMKERLCARSK